VALLRRVRVSLAWPFIALHVVLAFVMGAWVGSALATLPYVAVHQPWLIIALKSDGRFLEIMP